MTVADIGDDDELLAVLRRGLDDADPVPADALAAAAAAFDVGRADALLADLLFDSLLDEPLVTTRSGEATDRAVTYALGDRRLHVEVSRAERAVLGRLDPPAPAEVSLDVAGGTERTRTDERGRFHLPLPAGSLRLSVGVDDGRWVTPWLTR
jgi:hypothetical protein